MIAYVLLLNRATIVCMLIEPCYAIVSCSLVVGVLNLVMVCILFVFVTDVCECVVIEYCNDCVFLEFCGYLGYCLLIVCVESCDQLSHIVCMSWCSSCLCS